VKTLFWLSAFLVFYTYVLYPGWLLLRFRLSPCPVRPTPFFPKVSILIAARNEASHIENKLLNLQELHYPRELIDTIVVSDGSTDQTNEILRKYADSRIRSILSPVHCGKAESLNAALEVAGGEIVVFMDTRQSVSPDSVRMLVENFADLSVGCVSGELILDAGQANSTQGVTSYWKMEKLLRYWESAADSTVGATGALYAARRSLVPHLPPGLILDDVFIPMTIARRGSRVIFEPRALAWDNLPAEVHQEFRRKVRTLFGNYQLLRLAPWLLTADNRLRFEFLSHKLLRLAVPFALITMIVASAFLHGFVYRLPLAAATGVCCLGALAFVPVPTGITSRLSHLSLAFVLLNSAAVVAFWYFATGRRQVWVRG
jgi:cellulose synthase/poly-beta-1,6-N-acetylglucosamine synthase-like glycosyltransferase